MYHLPRCARFRAHLPELVRDHRGQGLVEFTLVVPVFLLFIFGIFQAALLYKANSALAQAATDGAHVLAAQSSSGPMLSDGTQDARFQSSWQSDGEALSYIQAALTTQGLANIQEIDIYPAVSSGGTPDQPTDVVQTRVITASDNIQPPFPKTVALVNKYGMQPPSGGPSCSVGQFYLLNSADPNNCVLPWNGDQYSYNKNQNGRSDQRCAESLVYVNVVYSYRPLIYPVIPAVTLSAHSVVPLEPRQYIVDAATQQGLVCSQFPAYNQ